MSLSNGFRKDDWGFVVGVLSALVVLFVLWSWRQADKAFASALKEENWVQVLRVDPDHEQALIGFLDEEVHAEEPDFEKLFENLDKAQSRELIPDRLDEIKALAHAKRARYSANQGNVAEAEKDLQQAEALGIGEKLAVSVKETLATALVKKAGPLLESGKKTDALQMVEKAESLHQPLDLPHSILDAIAERSTRLLREKNSPELREAALKAFLRLEKAGDPLGNLAKYRLTVAETLLSGLKGNSADFPRAADDYRIAVSLGGKEDGQKKKEITAGLVSDLENRKRQRDFNSVFQLLVTLSRLDATTAMELQAPFGGVSVTEVMKLTDEGLDEVPDAVLPKFPVAVIAMLEKVWNKHVDFTTKHQIHRQREINKMHARVSRAFLNK